MRPARGAWSIETVGPGHVVGWSWLVPPYRWHFDARALEPVATVAVDGACLRAKAEATPGVRLRPPRPARRMLLERLQATRIRLLDL